MRHNLMKTFDEIYILNLHGNAKRREQTPSGTKDENVFDITQGVAIALFVKHPKASERRQVFYADLWGERSTKYEALVGSDVSTTSWKELHPAAAFFEFVPVKRGLKTEYQSGWSVKDIFVLGSNGAQTSRDSLVVAFNKPELIKRIEEFADPEKSTEEIRSKFFGVKSVADYPPGDTREWKLADARVELQKNPEWISEISDYLYRPFDGRALLYRDEMVDWPRRDVMGHLKQSNRAICVGRAGLVAAGDWDLVFCANRVCDHNLFYRGSSLNFPLYLYEGEQSKRGGMGKTLMLALFESSPGYSTRRANLNPKFVQDLTQQLGLKWIPVDRGDLKKTVGPEDVFNYAYAIFHSPTYRERYTEFLKIDFPRLPLTSDLKLFRALAAKGAELVSLHLMESPKLDNFSTTFPLKGDDIVEKVQYTDNDKRVWINAKQYFGGVPKAVWEFHVGGYQVSEKWLKDRKGRKLTYGDIQHYQRTVSALAETRQIMAQIDSLISDHGSWPLE